MASINYHNKKFRPKSASGNSQTSSRTIFTYKQKGQLLWANYQGGKIKLGHLIGLVADDGSIEMRYHHIDINEGLQTGICQSRPELLDNGKILLHESWQWTSGDGSSGSSILEEC